MQNESNFDRAVNEAFRVLYARHVESGNTCSFGAAVDDDPLGDFPAEIVTGIRARRKAQREADSY